MKRLPFAILLCLTAMWALTSCLGDNNDDIDDDYLRDNTAFFNEQAALKNPDGSSFYTVVTPAWDSTSQVLVHWFNDTSLTSKNLKPIYTSTVDVKYYLTLRDGTAIDSSYNRTSPADSVFRTRLTNVISGWPAALTRMHIGDSCKVVIPYNLGYGVTNYSGIKAGSTLVFYVKLMGIPYYEAKP